MSGSWKLTLPCTRAEAETIEAADELPGLPDPPPVLTTVEPDPACPDEWRLEAFLDTEPGREVIAALRSLVPSALGIAPTVEAIADADWVALSQSGLPPIRAGRFLVHTAAHAEALPPRTVALSIEAGRAFGTGQHATTSGCLAMIDRLARAGRPFRRVLDLGTGTGVLAFAAAKTWPRARIVASDVDPIAIAVAGANATTNMVAPGRGRRRIELRTAEGLNDRPLRAGAPYDLVMANILAAPLVTMAPEVAHVLAPGGMLILAGLLHTQADAVALAYRRQGLRSVGRDMRGDWAILLMRRPGLRLRRGG